VTITTHMKNTIERFNNDFEYLHDHKQFNQSEHWRIPTEPTGEVVKDDCDGYATGLLYRLVKRDKKAFWDALESDKAAVVKVYAIQRDGSKGGSHAVLRWGDYYADNIYPYWRKELIHELRWEYSVGEVNSRMNGADKWSKLVEKAKDNKKKLIIGGVLAAVVILGLLA